VHYHVLLQVMLASKGFGTVRAFGCTDNFLGVAITMLNEIFVDLALKITIWAFSFLVEILDMIVNSFFIDRLERAAFQWAMHVFILV